jgi:hypothetical protein
MELDIEVHGEEGEQANEGTPGGRGPNESRETQARRALPPCDLLLASLPLAKLDRQRKRNREQRLRWYEVLIKKGRI